MTIIQEYLKLTKELKDNYGEKSLVLMQVGSFFECYALIDDKTGSYYGSNIQDFSDINDLVISKKNATHNNIPVVMAGFGLTQIEITAISAKRSITFRNSTFFTFSEISCLNLG